MTKIINFFAIIGFIFSIVLTIRLIYIIIRYIYCHIIYKRFLNKLKSDKVTNDLLSTLASTDGKKTTINFEELMKASIKGDKDDVREPGTGEGSADNKDSN